VAAFALAMEAKLRVNEHKGGWKDESVGYLVARLSEEVDELDIAAAGAQNPQSAMPMAARRAAVAGESANVGAFAMMTADVCGALPTLPAPPNTMPAEEYAPHVVWLHKEHAEMLSAAVKQGVASSLSEALEAVLACWERDYAAELDGPDGGVPSERGSR
jgi:hypothetical protein